MPRTDPVVSARARRYAARGMGIVVGVVVDRCCADPARFHPVAGFGLLAGHAERILNHPGASPPLSRAMGAAYTVALVTGTAAAGAFAERSLRRLPSAAALAAESITMAAATWVCVGGTSLLRVGNRLGGALESGDDNAARELLPWLCGRDPQALDRQEMARAVVESLAENTSDAHVAPVLWAAMLGTPGILAYRAANTLDAMVGHRSPRYRHFGAASARLDDLLNYLPARVAGALTVLAAAITPAADAAAARAAWRADAAKHPSPNAGVVEASAAGALGVRLGGRTPYPYGVQLRPELGNGRAVAVTDIARASRLERMVQDLATGLAVLGVFGWALWLRRSPRARRQKRERERRLRRCSAALYRAP